jgi:hypothetical protein
LQQPFIQIDSPPSVVAFMTILLANYILELEDLVATHFKLCVCDVFSKEVELISDEFELGCVSDVLFAVIGMFGSLHNYICVSQIINFDYTS